MSPARGKKAKSASKKKAAKASKPKAAAKGKGPATPERRHCAATDPFGDPCQSAPRLPSKYCTIHSYLDR